MSRTAMLVLLGGALMSAGALDQGCFPTLGSAPLGRLPPTIIPTNPGPGVGHRTLTVDLREYPEAHTINWDFGDGASAVGQPLAAGRCVTHEFLASGTFDVSVYLFAAPDLEIRRARLLAVGNLPIDVTAANLPPEAVFAVEDVRDDQGSPVPLARRFTASRSRDPDGAITAYEWDFGDGAHDHGEVIEHTFPRSARYVVRLTVTDDQQATRSAARTVLATEQPKLVRLVTSKGDILLELVDDAPVTTANFLQYVEDGFYNGTIFQRVVPGFIVQGGGLLPGMVPQEGVRDPIVNEFSPLRSNIRATVAMAKVGGDPDSATSEFFISLADNSENLDNQNGGFTVFARVLDGMDVADAIAAVELDGEQPVTDVVLIRAERL